MAQLPRRIFHSVEEFHGLLESVMKEIIQQVADELKTKLRDEYITTYIYKAYNPKFYERTYSLLDENTIEVYTYKNVSDKIGVGIRFNDEYYSAHSDRDKFQHGNDIRYLPMGSFLEIMNNSSKLHDNPYHFPTDINRYNFYDDFVHDAKEYFNTRVKDLVNARLLTSGRGNRPSATTRNPSNSGMNLSSSTSHLQSVGTYNV